jgi:ArsR family transcriptional regulator
MTYQNLPTKAIIEAYKALSNETRLKIVYYLAGKKSVSCKDISCEFQLSQPTLSHHFQKLLQADVIKLEKVGTQNHYSLNCDFLTICGIDYSKIQQTYTS